LKSFFKYHLKAPLFTTLPHREIAALALQFQVLAPQDIDEVYAYSEKRLRIEVPDDTERTFRSWAAKWRKEALEHYLKLGWSFIARDNSQAVGFFLGQPLLFFRGQTQTVWIEHIEARDDQVRASLIEIAVKVAREKHMQRVLFAEPDTLLNQSFGGREISDVITEVKTTKG
jgi:hypothetical protein